MAESEEIFLSFSSVERSAARVIVKGLQHRKMSVWFDEDDTQVGKAWREQITAGLSGARCIAVVLGSTGFGPVQAEEVSFALEQRTSDPDFRIIPVLLHGHPRPPTGDELVDRFLTLSGLPMQPDPDERFFEKLIQHLLGLPSDDGVSTLGDSPYPGLRPFRTDEAIRFFGRDELLAEVVDRLDEHRVLFLIGPSGTGKSSVAAAGLAKVLQDRSGPFGSGWDLVVLAPGARPIETVSARFGPGPLAERLAPENDGAGRIVVFDQFEELYLGEADAEQRAQFLDALLVVAQGCPDNLRVVVTLRSDFLGRVNESVPVGALVTERHVLVGPMTRAELTSAVQEPAWAAGARFERGLVDQILDDVIDQPNALPLLAFALEQMWPKASGDTLTIASYRDGGGVRGALERRADETVAPFLTDSEQLVRWLLLRLVNIEDGLAPTRRRATADELTPADPTLQPTADAVVASLVSARLAVASTSSTGTDQTSVQFSHDAIPGSWGRLREWIAAARVHGPARDELREAAQTWDENNRKRSYLLARDRIARLTSREVLAAGLLDRTEQLYVQRSRANARSLIVRVAVAAGMLLAAIGVAGATLVQTRRVSRERDTVAVLRLAAEAIAELRRRPDLGILLSAEAAARSSDIVARSALVSALTMAPQPLRFWDTTTRNLAAAGVVRSGEQTVVVAEGSAIHVCTPTARSCTTLLEPGGASINALAVSARLAQLAVVLSSGELLFGNLSTTPTAVAGVTNATAVALTPEQPVIVTGHRDGSIMLSALGDSSPGSEIARLRGAVRVLALDPKLRWVVAADEDGITVVPLDDTARRLDLWAGNASAVHVTTDGLLVAGDADSGDVLVWTLDATLSADTRPVRLGGHIEGPTHFLDVDGLLLSGDSRGDLRRWDTQRFTQTGPVLVARPSGDDSESVGTRIGVAGIGYDPSRERIIEVREDGVVVEWDRGDRSALSVASTQLDDDPISMASATKGQLAVLTRNGNIQLFDPSGALVSSHRSDQASPSAITIDPLGNSLVISGERIEMIPLGSLAGSELPTVGAGAYSAAAFSPNSELLAVADATGAIHVVDLATGNVARSISASALKVRAGTFRALRFGPDNQTLAGVLRSNDDFDVRVVEADDTVRVLVGHRAEVDSLAFASDGSYLYSGSDDRTIRRWTSGSWEVDAIFDDHADRVTGIATLEGGLLASSSQDGTVRLWDLSADRQLGEPLRWGPGVVDDVKSAGPQRAVSRTGRTLVWWMTAEDDWMRRACEIAGRTLTNSEMSRLPGRKEPFGCKEAVQ